MSLPQEWPWGFSWAKSPFFVHGVGKILCFFSGPFLLGQHLSLLEVNLRFAPQEIMSYSLRFAKPKLTKSAQFISHRLPSGFPTRPTRPTRPTMFSCNFSGGPDEKLPNQEGFTIRGVSNGLLNSLTRILYHPRSMVFDCPWKSSVIGVKSLGKP